MVRVKTECSCLEGECSTRSFLIFTLQRYISCMSHSVYSNTHRERSSIAVYRDALVFLAHGNDLLGSQFLKNVCKIDSGIIINSFIHISKKSVNTDQLENFFPTSIIDDHHLGNASDGRASPLHVPAAASFRPIAQIVRGVDVCHSMITWRRWLRHCLQQRY